MNRQTEKAHNLFFNQGGILRTSQALELGISSRTLYAMRDAGQLRKLSRGIYQLATQVPPTNPDFVSVALRIPNAVICLISALSFYNLTTQIPHKVYIAVPQSAEKPRFDYPPLDIVWLSEKVYLAGITQQQVDGIPIKIYSREKTIADCFKFRNKIGIDVAMDALKEYVNNPRRNLNQLLVYAQIDRVEPLISRYLEVLL
ncbi:MAG: type IV toxin-antitoxin system AbiEi family antitoxin domain-containing protein [Kiritimatiellae bacterium]|nr:type IV toxin-antitoxin system AbiEi family antitoxin domain-containing protein [Kiritimatiellia bacterium]